MDTFVKNVYKNANYKVSMFSKIRKYITTYAATLIYKQTIVPFLDYACFLMDSAHQYALSCLAKIHKRCIRIIEYKKKGDREQNLQQLLDTYRIQNLLQRRKVQLLTFMFSENKNPENLKLESPEMTLRSNNKVKFKERFSRKTTVLKSPLYRGFALWNNLTEELKKIDSLLSFKKRIKSLYYAG